MGSLPPRRPGILLVHPKLKNPSEETAEIFLRWTKLHYRDLLNIPETPALGRTTHALRFSRSIADAYFYTVLVEDIGILQSEAYYRIPRTLDLESTRALGEEEEAVGKVGEVWEVVDVVFGVFENVEGCEGNFTDISYNPADPKPTIFEVSSYQIKPLASTTSTTHLVTLTIHNVTFRTSVLTLQHKLLHYLTTSTAPSELSGKKVHIASSVYHYAGAAAQPADHPIIDVDVSGEWLIVASVEISGTEGEEGGNVVKEWIAQWDGEGSKDEGLEVEVGVWKGEVFMA